MDKWADSLDIGAFYTVSDEDFVAISSLLDSAVPYTKPVKVVDTTSPAYLAKEVVRLVALDSEEELVAHLLAK